MVSPAPEIHLIFISSSKRTSILWFKELRHFSMSNEIDKQIQENSHLQAARKNGATFSSVNVRCVEILFLSEKWSDITNREKELKRYEGLRQGGLGGGGWGGERGELQRMGTRIWFINGVDTVNLKADVSSVSPSSQLPRRITTVSLATTNTPFMQRMLPSFLSPSPLINLQILGFPR